MIHLLAVLAVFYADPLPLPEGLTTLRTYAAPTDPDMVLGLPGAMDFDEAGNLYLLDQQKSHVLVWDAAGTLRRGFGQKGLEEGQMRNPIALAVGSGEVWVWCRDKLMFVYDTEGTLIRTIRFPEIFPRALAVLGPNRVLLGTETFQEGRLEMKVLLFTGATASEVIRFDNPMMLGRDPGNADKTLVKAYGPDLDIQQNDRGHWYIGFGEAPFLFAVDAEGTIRGQVPFSLPPNHVTPEQQAYLEKADFPVWSGHRIALVDEETQLSYKEPTAGFTQFALKGDKALFLLTATGGYPTDLYPPADRALYRIVDMKTQTLTASGSYALPKDAKLFARRGKLIAALPVDQGFQVMEIGLKGW